MVIGHVQLAEAALAEDASGVPGVVADFAAELGDGVAHGLRIGATPVAPHPAPERLVDRRPAGVEQEGVQKLVLDGGELHQTASDGHPARPAVDSKSLCSQRELTYDCMIQTEMPAGNAGRFSSDCFEDVKPAMLRTKWGVMT